MSAADDAAVFEYLHTALPESLSFNTSAPPPPPHNAQLYALLREYDALMSEQKVRTAIDLADVKAITNLFAGVQSEDEMLMATHTVLSRLRTADDLSQLMPFYKDVEATVSKTDIDAVLALSDVNGLFSFLTSNPKSEAVKRFGAVTRALLLMSSSKH